MPPDAVGSVAATAVARTPIVEISALSAQITP
jgi:hypothetical protein